MTDRGWKALPVRRCLVPRCCRLCREPIQKGEDYHDGRSKWAHVHCVDGLWAIGAKIAHDLFTIGDGTVADHISLEKNGRILGGWGETPMGDHIAILLDKAGVRVEEKR